MGGNAMKILTAAMSSLLAMTAIGWSQTDLYTDANGPSPLISGWVASDTAAEISTEAYEGTLCLAITLQGTSWWAGGGFAYTNQWQLMDWSYNTTFSFACKSNNPYVMSSADIVPIYTDTSVHATPFVFHPTTEWQVFTVQLSDWSAVLSGITMLNYAFHGSQAVMTGEVYFDAIQLDAIGNSVKQPRQAAVPHADNRLTFKKDGYAQVNVFTLNGQHTAVFSKQVMANTPYSLSDLVINDLHAGAYIVRITGAGVNYSQKLIK